MKEKRKARTGFPSVNRELEWICAENSEIRVPGMDGATTCLRFWLEVPTDVVVSADAMEPGEPLPPIDESLRRAAWQPAVGPPRFPKVIRVADPSIAGRLREINGLKCEVRLAPTPEADVFLENLVRAVTEIDAREDYLRNGRIRPSVVDDLFKAAKALYPLAPWRTIRDSDLIRVDIPALKVDEQYLSLMGIDGDFVGFRLFSSFDDYLEFVDAETRDMEDSNDEPSSVNSSWLGLEFVPEDDISPKRRAQIVEHDWIVAGPEAFPDFSRFDHGQATETLERDIRILASCARALIPFLSTSGSPDFDLNALDGRSFVGPDGIEVFLEPVFEPEEADEPGFETPELLPPPAPKVGRNDACPCGSGKKFKKCCMNQSAGSPREDVHQMDSRVVAHIMDFAWRRHKVSETRIFREFANPEVNAQLAYPYFAYCSEIGGRRLVDIFLQEKGRNLPERERHWVEAQSRSWLSIWEIENVDSGRGMTLADLLTGQRRTVVEKAGSSQAVRRMALLGRVVDFESFSVVCGSHVQPLPPGEAAVVVELIREQLHAKQPTPIKSLQNYEASRLMLAEWERAVAELDARSRQRPQLQNTDGDSLLATVDRFTFDLSDLKEIESRLSEMESVIVPETDEDPREFIFERANPPNSPMSSTTIGTVRIVGTTLVAETNSVERAEALRTRIENACGSLLKPALREHVDFLTNAKREPAGDFASTREEKTIPPEVSSTIIRQFKQRYYSTWLDQPIPALGGKTPREAAKTTEGRKQLEALLKQVEYTEARSSPEDPFDVSTLRAKLGLVSGSGN